MDPALGDPGCDTGCGANAALRLPPSAGWSTCRYVIMLEPDNTVHGPITHPMEFDAGGLHEDNPRFGERIVSLVEVTVTSHPSGPAPIG